MAVAIRKTQNIKKELSEIFAELNFIPGKRVFIKPNLCGREPILPGENSSVEVMDALVEVLLELGCEISIGHGVLLGSHDHSFSFEEVIKASGFEKYRKLKGVKLVNLDELPRQEIKTDDMVFHLPIQFLRDEVDTYINLAKIKTHMETGVSLSLKNQMGLLSPDDRVKMHQTDLEKTIGLLALNCKPVLSILEGFPAMEKNGPHHGSPKDLNIIAAGLDHVELDSFVCQLLGYGEKEIKHINYAVKLSAGKIFEPGNLENYINFIVSDFKKAQKIHRFGNKFFAYPTYSCSRCITAVNSFGKELKKHPFKYWRIILKAFFSKSNINIVFGRADDLDLYEEKKICVGHCSKVQAMKNNSPHLDKCPPGLEETKEFLIRHINNR